MRKIEELFEEGKRIWFHIDSDEAGVEFIKEVKASGGKFSDGSVPDEHSCGRIMAFGPDKRLAYVSILVWSLSFSPNIGNNNALKVEYSGFKRGDEDYIIKENKYRSIIFTETVNKV